MWDACERKLGWKKSKGVGAAREGLGEDHREELAGSLEAGLGARLRAGFWEHGEALGMSWGESLGTSAWGNS